MRIGIIGSGVVAQTLGGHLAEGGHEVVLGTRDPRKLDDRKGLGGTLRHWLDRAGKQGRVATFREAVEHAEVAINATAGQVSVAALEQAGADRLKGGILIDTANPLDFSRGMPPTLTICNDDSLGERIQKAFPSVRVVKALNTLTASLMVNPASVGAGDHHLFICGNDTDAKGKVARYLGDWFGWRVDRVLDVGDITCARGTEMILPLWVRLWSALGTPMFNFRIVQ